MGASRKTDKGLPERVYVEYGKQRKNGSRPKPYYYYKPVKGQRIKLGETEAKMYRKLSEIKERPKNINDMGDLIDDFMQTIASELDEESYKNEAIRAKFIKAFFKDFLAPEVTPQDIYEYMALRSQKQKVEVMVKGKKRKRIIGGKVAANKDRSLLMRIFAYGIRKGKLKENPCREVERYQEKSRDRYPEDWEFKAVYNAGSDILQCILDFAYLSGQRRGDILSLQETQITEEGIYILQSKGIKKKPVKILIEWSVALKDCVNRARKLRGNIRSLYLFCKENGQRYTKDGFKSMYKRAMIKAIGTGTITEKFNFHDIRAKTYSDDENESQRIKRAGHADASMGRVYDRKYKKVKPLK